MEKELLKCQFKNSKGLNLVKEVNAAMLGAYIIASDGKDQRTAFEYVLSNDYNDFDLEKIATEGAKKAVALLGATPVESGDYEILLENTASCSLLGPHISMFSAESVQKNVSLLQGKVGEKIANELITFS